ncbi:hypothetical protein DPSP01_008149 [Paraphaeosphaeria sporulosa]
MPSNKRARSADDNMSNEEMTIPERSQDTHIIDDFTVQPVKPWKQYWAELGKLRRDVEAKGEGPPDIVPIEANKHVKNVPPAKGPAKKLRPIPGNGDTTSHDDEDDADDTEHDCGQNSDNDEFAEFNYLEHMDGMVDKVDPASPKKTLRVGYCDAKLIRRNRMHSFYSDLEQPTQETSMPAFELFDRYGRLKLNHKEHTVQKGSGIWGDELDNGDLLLIAKSLSRSRNVIKE